MCQDYILQQRQMQMEAQMEFNAQVNPEAIMGENGYNKVMQYVDQIGENLKTPKVSYMTDIVSIMLTSSQNVRKKSMVLQHHILLLLAVLRVWSR